VISHVQGQTCDWSCAGHVPSQVTYMLDYGQVTSQVIQHVIPSHMTCHVRVQGLRDLSYDSKAMDCNNSSLLSHVCSIFT
jgi:hypothetical protein